MTTYDIYAIFERNFDFPAAENTYESVGRDKPLFTADIFKAEKTQV